MLQTSCFANISAKFCLIIFLLTLIFLQLLILSLPLFCPICDQQTQVLTTVKSEIQVSYSKQSCQVSIHLKWITFKHLWDVCAFQNADCTLYRKFTIISYQSLWILSVFRWKQALLPSTQISFGTSALFLLGPKSIKVSYECIKQK